MICPNCKIELPDGMKFCSSCGTPLSAPEVADAATSAVQEVAEDVPSASFDPGAPIAIPKQKEVIPDVSSEIPEVIPEIAPVEEVVPEFSQINQTPVAEPAVAVAPIPEPAAVVAPIPEPAAVVAPSSVQIPAPAPVQAPAPTPVPPPVALNPETMTAPVYSAAPYQAPVTPSASAVAEEKPLKTVTAFFLMLLFSIPVVGLISSIILSAAGKRCKSRKSFARAVLIWKIILIIAVLSLVILVYFMYRDIFDAAMSGDFEDLIDTIRAEFDF